MKLLSIILTLIIAVLPSCSTNTGDAQKDRAGRITNAALEDTFNVVAATAAAYGTSALSGQNGQDAAQAAFVSAGMSNGSKLVGTLITEYAGDKAKPIADVAAQQVAKLDPKTPAEKQLVLNTIGAAIQQVANQHAGN